MAEKTIARREKRERVGKGNIIYDENQWRANSGRKKGSRNQEMDVSEIGRESACHHGVRVRIKVGRCYFGFGETVITLTINGYNKIDWRFVYFLFQLHK